MSFKEARSHFGAWCIVSSPLILSHDVNSDAVMGEIWPIISNREAIAVNQAWAGHSGSPFKQSATNITLSGFADQTEKPIIGDNGVAKGGETPLPSWHFFHKPLGSGKVAVLLMSHTEAEQSLTLHFADVPGLSCSRCSVRDVWLREDVGVHNDRYTATGLAGHDSAFLILSPAPRAPRQAFAEVLRGAGAPTAAQPARASAQALNARPSVPVSNKHFLALQLDSRLQQLDTARRRAALEA
jgi:alpha-galactosidase